MTFKSILSSVLCTAVIAVSCCNEQKTPKAKHVIFIGLDALSAVGIQRAETPNFNRMIENGAISLHTRVARETSSSQNWMCMVSGAPIEMTGVTDNSWEYETRMIEPAVHNAKGMFPTIFDIVKEQRPEARVYGFYEWAGQCRMYDMDSFDYSENCKNGEETLRKAFAKYLEDQPELLFVSVDHTDHAGHSFGHEDQGYFDAITLCDGIIGEFVDELEKRGMMKDIVIMVTGDHGGVRYGHGGDNMCELEVPVLMYGKGVTKGKVMKHANMIYDNAATIAGLLGVKLPPECRGKFIMQAFEPSDGEKYVPIPLVHPFRGVAEQVSITVDDKDATVYYTTDGSTPTVNSPKYEGPFKITDNTVVKAVTCKDNQYSEVVTNLLYAKAPEGYAPIGYKLYRNYFSEQLPDFTKFGRADAVGYVSNFTLDGIPVKPEEDDFAVIFTSNLKIAKSGKYRFLLGSDDGSRLIIDGKTVIDNDGSHTYGEKFGVIELEEGLHKIKVEYFEDCDGQSLNLSFGLDGQGLFPMNLKDLEK
ncbi:MAG: alkaline phosphatase family protein [Bacteroidales bacterium]|nr:alkaline phosphatase family protein [Bacteroidales bacterium]